MRLDLAIEEIFLYIRSNFTGFLQIRYYNVVRFINTPLVRHY